MIRHANMEDAKDIYDWRHDPITIKESFTKGPISYQSHLSWFENALENETIFIGEENKSKIGIVRFSNSEEGFIVSINTNPSFRGFGKGAQLLSQACQHFMLGKTETTLYAHIKPTNQASIACFEKCDFKLDKKTDTKLIYKRK